MQGWVDEKKKKGMIVETVRLEEKCRGWVEVKEPGAAMRAQVKAKKGAVRRKEERCNRNERGTPAVDNWSSDVPTQSERFSTWGYYTTGAQTLKPHYSPRVRTSLFLPLAGAREGGESRAEYLREKYTFRLFSVHFREGTWFFSFSFYGTSRLSLRYHPRGWFQNCLTNKCF